MFGIMFLLEKRRVLVKMNDFIMLIGGLYMIIGFIYGVIGLVSYLYTIVLLICKKLDIKVNFKKIGKITDCFYQYPTFFVIFYAMFSLFIIGIVEIILYNGGPFKGEDIELILFITIIPAILHFIFYSAYLYVSINNLEDKIKSLTTYEETLTKISRTTLLASLAAFIISIISNFSWDTLIDILDDLTRNIKPDVLGSFIVISIMIVSSAVGCLLLQGFIKIAKSLLDNKKDKVAPN